MVLGLGVHVVEVARLARLLGRRGERFERRVFSPRELEDCRGRRDRSTALAARCAAKGACLRALGGAWSSRLTPRQIEVTRAEGGQPGLKLAGVAADLARDARVATSHVSLSHEGGLAVAVVILEG